MKKGFVKQNKTKTPLEGFVFPLCAVLQSTRSRPATRENE